MRRIILADLDNLRLCSKLTKITPHIDYHIFASRNHGHKLIGFNQYPNCFVHIPKMVGKNVCDIELTYRAHRIQLMYEKNSQFAVYSKDNFAAVLAQIMRETSSTDHLCSEDELRKWLR